MRKQILAVVLAIVLTLSLLLTGCSSFTSIFEEPKEPHQSPVAVELTNLPRIGEEYRGIEVFHGTWEEPCYSEDGKGYFYEERGWIYLHIEGDPATRGYQHGWLLADHIQRNRDQSKTMLAEISAIDWEYFRVNAERMWDAWVNEELRTELEGIVRGASERGASFDYLDLLVLNGLEELRDSWFPTVREAYYQELALGIWDPQGVDSELSDTTSDTAQNAQDVSGQNLGSAQDSSGTGEAAAASSNTNSQATVDSNENKSTADEAASGDARSDGAATENAQVNESNTEGAQEDESSADDEKTSRIYLKKEGLTGSSPGGLADAAAAAAAAATAAPANAATAAAAEADTANTAEVAATTNPDDPSVTDDNSTDTSASTSADSANANDVVSTGGVEELNGAYIKQATVLLATGSATKDGDIILAQNVIAAYADSNFSNVMIDLDPEEGQRFTMQAAPGLIHSIAEAYSTESLLIANTSIKGFNAYGEAGIPEFLRIRWAAQYAETLDAFTEIMAQGTNGGLASSWLVGELESGWIMELELGLSFYNEERLNDGCFISFNGADDARILNFETEGSSQKDTRQSIGSRQVRLKELSGLYIGKLTAEIAQDIITDHYDVYLSRLAASSRSICAHFDTDDAQLSAGVGALPYMPYGTVDAKVMSTKLASENIILARWGSACGRAFDSAAFLQKNPQYSELQDYLFDRPSQNWDRLYPLDASQ